MKSWKIVSILVLCVALAGITPASADGTVENLPSNKEVCQVVINSEADNNTDLEAEIINEHPTWVFDRYNVTIASLMDENGAVLVAARELPVTCFYTKPFESIW